MLNSFSTGLSGLRANQVFLDVIGNNLANLNTIGYRADRVSFSDLFQQTLRPASAPGTGLGGVNPSQVGLGVGLGSVEKLFVQGNLQSTGRTFDLALSGDGFFRLNDGRSDFFTRAGAFGLDASHNLVDLTTGYKVQSASGADLVLDTESVLPGKATSLLEMAGNLPGKVTGPTAEILSSGAFKTGTAATLTGTETGWTISGDSTIRIHVDGESYDVALTDGSDITGVIQAIQDAGVPVTAADDGSGALVLTSPTRGTTSSLQVEDVTGSAAATIGLPTEAVIGTEAAATADTLLNDLLTNETDYDTAGPDKITISGVDADGSTVTAEMEISTGSETLGDLLASVDAAFTASTATLDSAGKVVLTADTPGEANLSLTLADATGNVGQTDWSNTAFRVTSDGKGPDTLTTSIDVLDANGQAHALTLTFVRESAGVWNMNASIPDGEGTVIQGSINGITFNDDGTLSGFQGDGTVEIQFSGMSADQVIQIDLGTPGAFDGLTQFGDTSTAHVQSQDGFAPGTLTSLYVDPDGSIQGVYSNGEISSLGRIGVTRFSNPAGLRRAGDNLFEKTPNSGEPVVSDGGQNGAAQVLSGVLEASNVDASQEFVNLILAQRGFQANSRVITAGDAILQELLSITR